MVIENETSLVQELERLRHELLEMRRKGEAQNKLSLGEFPVRQIAENIDEILWISDAEKKNAFYVNSRYEDIFGISAEEFYEDPRSHLELIHPEDKASILDVWDKQDPYDLDLRIVRPDGEIRWIRERSFSAKDENGDISQIIGMILDITDQKESEQQLKTAKENLEQNLTKLNSLFVSLDDGLIFIGTGSHKLQANPAAMEMHGIDEQFLNEPGSWWKDKLKFYDLEGRRINFEDWPLQRVFRCDYFKDYQLQFHNVSIGINRIISYSGNCIKGELGEELVSVLICKDITAEKRAVQEVVESEKRYESLFRNNHSVMLVVDPETQEIVDANPAACKFYGYTQEQILDMHIGEINTHSEDVGQKLGEAVTEESTRFEFRHRLANGEIRNVEVYTGPILLYGRTMVYSIVHDITAAKRTERKLKETASLPMENPHPVLRITNTGRIAFKNPASGPLIKAAKKEDIWDMLVEKILKYYSSGSRMDLPLKLGNRFFAITAVPYVSDGYINVYVHDITARKSTEQNIRNQNLELARANRELAKANAKLRELDKLKTDFVSEASHELRTPLTSLIGFSQTLLSPDLELTQEQRAKYLKIIESEGKRLSSLLAELLDISRIETGKMRMQLNRVNYSKLIHEVVDRMKVPSEIKINIEEPEQKAYIYIDKDRTKEVFVNIISNAIRYTPAGGRIIISYEDVGTEILTKISDTGPGIRHEELDKIFEKFYRSKDQTLPPVRGSGLGLSIAKGIVLAHGGNIWAESKLRKGSTFLFTLPKNRGKG